jgi:hypothetical protein
MSPPPSALPKPTVPTTSSEPAPRRAGRGSGVNVVREPLCLVRGRRDALLWLRPGGSRDCHGFTGSSEDADDFCGLRASAAEPVGDCGVEGSDLTGPEHDVLVSENKSHVARQDVDPLVPVVRPRFGGGLAGRNDDLSCLYSAGLARQGDDCPALDSAGFESQAGVAFFRRCDKVVERHAVGMGAQGPVQGRAPSSSRKPTWLSAVAMPAADSSCTSSSDPRFPETATLGIPDDRPRSRSRTGSGHPLGDRHIRRSSDYSRWGSCCVQQRVPRSRSVGVGGRRVSPTSACLPPASPTEGTYLCTERREGFVPAATALRDKDPSPMSTEWSDFDVPGIRPRR